MPCRALAVSSSPCSLLRAPLRMNAPVAIRVGARRSLAARDIGGSLQRFSRVNYLDASPERLSDPGRKPHVGVPLVLGEQPTGEQRPHPGEVGDDQTEVGG